MKCIPCSSHASGLALFLYCTGLFGENPGGGGNYRVPGKEKRGEGWPVSLLRGSNSLASIVGLRSSGVRMLFSLMFLFCVKKHRNVVVFAYSGS